MKYGGILEFPSNTDFKERRFLTKYSEHDEYTYLLSIWNQNFDMLYKIRTDYVQIGYFLGPTKVICWLKENKGAKIYDVTEDMAYDQEEANPKQEVDTEKISKYSKFIIKQSDFVGGGNNSYK